MQYVAVGRQDEFQPVFRTGRGQPVERRQVVAHVAVGRRDDGGAAVEHMVAAEQQAVVGQQQAQVVGGVARHVDDAQIMGLCRPGERDVLLIQ